MPTSMKIDILDPSASPQTGVADSNSAGVTVGPRDPDNRLGVQTRYDVTFSATLVSGSATMTPYLCNDPDESPRRWVQIKKLQDDGTDAALTRTGSFNLAMSLPAESMVRWTISASSTPVVYMTARGVIR